MSQRTKHLSRDRIKATEIANRLPSGKSRVVFQRGVRAFVVLSVVGLWVMGFLRGCVVWIVLSLGAVLGTVDRAEAYYYLDSVTIEGGLPEVTVGSGESITLDGIVTGSFGEFSLMRNRWSSDSPGATLEMIPLGMGSNPHGQREISARFDAPVVTTDTVIVVTVNIGFTSNLSLPESSDFATGSDTINVLVRAPAAPAGPNVQAFQTRRINALIQEQPDLSSVFDAAAGPGVSASTMGDALSVTAGMGGPVWAEVRGNQSVLDGATGSYVLGAVGAHWQARPGVVLGLMAMIDRMETEAVTGTGWLAGPYAVFRADGQPLVFQARYLLGDSRNRLEDGTAFASRRSLAMVGLSGSVMRGDLEIVPSLRAAHGREVSDAFVMGNGLEVPSEVTALTQVETGLAVAFPVDLGTGETRLRMGISDIWTDGSAALDGHRAELSVLLRHRTAAGAELTLRLARDGLGMSGFKATRAAVNYGISF